MDPTAPVPPLDPVPTVSSKRLGDGVVAPAGLSGDGLVGAGVSVGGKDEDVGVYVVRPVSDIVSNGFSAMLGIVFNWRF